MEYLCGCSQESKRNYSFGGIRRDKEGYESCPEHGERFKNWRSLERNPKELTGRTIDASFNTVSDSRDLRDATAIGEARLRARKTASNGHTPDKSVLASLDF